MSANEQRNMSIIGLGAYIPDEVRTNAFWSDSLVEKWSGRKKDKTNFLHLGKEDNTKKSDDMHPLLSEELNKYTGDPFVGMKERRVSRVLPSEMERKACEEALKDAKLNPNEIDLFMCFSLPSDRVLPPNIYKLHYELGLVNANCFEICSICNSSLTMLDIADQYIKTHKANKVLIVVSTTYSSIMDYSSSVSVMAGDGAAAIVLRNCPEDKGFEDIYTAVDSQFHDSMTVQRRAPLRKETPSFEFGEIQSSEKMFFTINDPQKSQLLISKIPFWAEEVKKNLFDKRYYSPSNVDLIVTNAATAWYSTVIARILNISSEKIEDNILEFSNMGAVNLLMNLYTAYKKGRLKNDDKVLFFSHGGGASYGAAILKWYKP
ncbi:MAG: 3-oxoacyl-(acyl-carrier-protein) synthase related protein, partial [Sedimentibacter sp.]|nr:3-oxoacyl-(acyl-carrier-protein) synthase related protein [Sedimentibacter sp.]